MKDLDNFIDSIIFFSAVMGWHQLMNWINTFDYFIPIAASWAGTYVFGLLLVNVGYAERI